MAQDRWYNPLMRWLLRSPFHWLVSSNILLISFTGRSYSTPINYSRRGRLIRLIGHQGLAWLRNVEGGAPVTIRLRGKDLPGTASIVAASRIDTICALREVYPGLSVSKAIQLADDSVLIQVRLAQVETQPAARPAHRATYRVASIFRRRE